jgi:hypothetical protein
VRLTRRDAGGFRLEGAAEAPIEGVPEPGGMAVRKGAATTRIAVAFAGGGATWPADAAVDGPPVVLTWGSDGAGGPASLLLPDGQLFRITVVGLTEPSVEVARWDVPGPYLVGRRDAAGWSLDWTAAGGAIASAEEIALAASYEIGRRDGWW